MRIHFNWGTGIVIALLGYVGIIALLLIISSKQDRSVMREDYYYHSIHHQDEIDASQRFNDLGAGLIITHVHDTVFLYLPSFSDSSQVKVKVAFLRPSDEKLDFAVETIQSLGRNIAIPASRFKRGKYYVRFEMEKNGQVFLHEMDYIFNP